MTLLDVLLLMACAFVIGEEAGRTHGVNVFARRLLRELEREGD